jgi:small subunit ribosomal protein S8
MTSVTDPIGDLLTRMRNAQSAKHDSCRAPYSRVKHALLETMKRDGWIVGVEKIGEDPKFELEVTFSPEKPRLELSRVSKPGRRIYEKHSTIKPVLQGFGVSLVSTSQGIMTDKEARAKHVGGEVLCTIA